MRLTDAEKNRLKKVGLSRLNTVKRTPKHPKKKAVVAVRDGSKVKIIRFGDQSSSILVILLWVTTIARKLARVSRLATPKI